MSAITIARVAALPPLYPYWDIGTKEMNRRKEIEEMARKKGVALAAPVATPAPAPPPGAAGQAVGWMARVMPNAAPMMADLRAQLGPFYAAALDNLKRGRGHVVDLGTNIAVGNPPLDQFDRGKTEQRDGLTVMRVRPRS